MTLKESSATSGSAVPAVDLEIRVTLTRRKGSQRLDYVLSSPSRIVSFHEKKIRGPEIERPPKEFHRQLLRQIEKLGSNPSELEDLGRGLFRQLFPFEMRDAYRKFRGDVKTLLITSDEPWIPWELIKPFDDSDPENVIDDDFLCVQFQLTRWLAGETQPGATIGLRRMAYLEAQSPEGPALSPGEKEWDALAELAGGKPDVELISLREPQRDEVVNLIRSGDLDLLHFSGHGGTDAEHPDEARIALPEWQDLRARSLDGPLILEIKKRRPLVFLNACRAAEQGWVLTSLGGWAEAWVQRCGCSAFLGPQWSVSDHLAGDFAEAFYQALAAGETIGRAAQGAREQVRERQPGDSTWLAYAVYAHPNARVVLGDRPLTAEAPCPRPPQVRPRQPDSPREVAGKPAQRQRASFPDAWLRTLRTAAFRRPLATGFLAAPLIVMLLLAGCFLLGDRTHQARETLVEIEGLSYPGTELLRTGARVVLTLPWKGIHALLIDHATLRWCAVALLVITLGWLVGLGRLRASPGWLLSALVVAALVLSIGSAFYTFAVRASNLHIRGARTLGRAPELSGNVRDRIAVETASWLRNDSPRNEDRREALNGLILWLLLATGTGMWAGIRARAPGRRSSRLRWTLVGAHLLVFLFLLDKLPHAHAMGEWGHKYPRVVAAECDPELAAVLASGKCRIYDVSAGARERKLKRVGTCSLKRDTVVEGCDPELGPKEVIGSVQVQMRANDQPSPMG